MFPQQLTQLNDEFSLLDAAMLDSATLEQRLIALEKIVFALQRKLDSKPSSDNWLANLIGSISDDEVFLEALAYGRTFRQSDRPIDEVSKQSCNF